MYKVFLTSNNYEKYINKKVTIIEDNLYKHKVIGIFINKFIILIIKILL